MRQGKSPQEAALKTLERIVAHRPKDMRDQSGQPNFNLNFYVVNKKGECAGAAVWTGTYGASGVFTPVALRRRRCHGSPTPGVGIPLQANGAVGRGPMRSPPAALADWFVDRLTRPRRRYHRFVYNDPEKLKATIAPGDVLLVDGRSAHLAGDQVPHDVFLVAQRALHRRRAAPTRRGHAGRDPAAVRARGDAT